MLHVTCGHHALGAVLLSSMRLVRSAMGEYLVLALGTAGYRLGPLRKGTYGTFLIGQSAPFLIHLSPNWCSIQIRSSLKARDKKHSGRKVPGEIFRRAQHTHLTHTAAPTMMGLNSQPLTNSAKKGAQRKVNGSYLGGTFYERTR